MNLNIKSASDIEVLPFLGRKKNLPVTYKIKVASLRESKILIKNTLLENQ